MDGYQLLIYYEKYLKEIRQVSDTTVKHYKDALRYISRFLADRGKIEKSIFEIQDIKDLEVLREYLYSDLEFLDLNKRGHQMYSAGFNNYYRFANGEGFKKISKKIEIMDTEIPVKETRIITSTEWKRSNIIKVQSIESAGYLCEIDSNHITFTSKGTGHQYMEGHHAIPIKYQNEFENSLDVYANIVCLCPICHRLLHYGVESEKETVVKKIYHDRADRLALSGLRISERDFSKLII